MSIHYSYSAYANIYLLGFVTRSPLRTSICSVSTLSNPLSFRCQRLRRTTHLTLLDRQITTISNKIITRCSRGVWPVWGRIQVTGVRALSGVSAPTPWWTPSVDWGHSHRTQGKCHKIAGHIKMEIYLK